MSAQLPEELILRPIDIHMENQGKIQKESLYEDHKGFIWAGTGQGYSRWDGKEWTHINLFANDKKNELEVIDILYRPDVGYIFSAGTNGVVMYNDIDDEFKYINSIEVNNEEVPFTAMNATKYGYQTLVATTEGSLVLSENGNIIKIDRPQDDNPGSNHTGHHKNGLRRTIMDSQENTYYFGGNGGLYSRQYKAEKCISHPQPFNNDYHVNKEVKNFQLQYIYQSGRKIYGPSWGSGVMIFDIDNKSWDRRRELERPERTVVLNMLNTHGDNWLVTRITNASGIGLFNEEYDHIVEVLGPDGQPMKSRDAIIQDNCGRIWLSCISDIETFAYAPIPLINNPKGIYINSLSIDNELQTANLDFWDNKVVQLLPSQRKLDLSFRAINPLSYDSIKYEYRMKGIHEEWRSNGVDEEVTYDIIGSGEYTFEARFWNAHTKSYINTNPLLLKKSNLNFNDRSTQLKIGGGIVGLIGLLSLLYFFFYKSKIKSREKEFQNKLLEVQTLALRSQMNPHFLFNCMNSIRYFIVKNENDKAAEYLTKFSRLMRNILENSARESISITEEVNTLNLYLEMEKLRFEDKFDYTVEYIGESKADALQMPTMIIQPFVENALIHGIKDLDGKGKITVTIEEVGNTLKCTITDNGIGREHSRKRNSEEKTVEKSSLGMKITQQRLELLKKSNNKIEIHDLRDKKEDPTGTKVVVWIDY